MTACEPSAAARIARPGVIAGLALLAACGPIAADRADNASERRATATAPAPQALQLRAADGVVVHATHYPTPQPRAVILLFHQANGSASEYATIAPRLAALGFESLAIDQRAGGTLFGPNRTVVARGASAAFLDAEPDLEAAFAWGRARKLPVIVWGSSYSAALAIRLAARHCGAIAAVLTFSPGEYLDQPDAVRDAARLVSVPLFVTAASNPAERAAATAVLAAAPSTREASYMPATGGLHGASVLSAERNPAGHAAAWQATEAFLAGLP